MKKFMVTSEFMDKYTNAHYVPGVFFMSDEPERIADLQNRKLIGEEIPLPSEDGEKVKKVATKRKASAEDKPE